MTAPDKKRPVRPSVERPTRRRLPRRLDPAKLARLLKKGEQAKATRDGVLFPFGGPLD